MIITSNKAVMGLTGLVDPSETLEVVATGSIWSKGPLWIPARKNLRWSDIPNNRIREYNTVTKDVTDYATDVEFTNGRTLDQDCSVVQCSHGRRRVECDRAGVVESIVSRWRRVRLNSPNDIVLRLTGQFDSLFPDGIIEAREGHPGEREYGNNYVFRYDQMTQ